MSGQLRLIVLVGGGGAAREILAVLESHPARGTDWAIGGYLDDAPHGETAMGMLGAGIPHLGPAAGHEPSVGNLYVCGVGAPVYKRALCDALVARGAAFLTLVAASAEVGPRVTLGRGTVIMPFASVTVDAHVGDFVMVNRYSSIGHDVRVGSYTTLSSHCDICGKAELGESVFVGSHGSVLPGAHVGDGATVGAGSVVPKRVAPGVKVLGVPARPLPF